MDEQEQIQVEQHHKLSQFFSPCGKYLTIHVNGDVMQNSLNEAIDSIILANTFWKGDPADDAAAESVDLYSKLTHINLFVSSQGGDLGECFRLLTAIDSSNIPVRTIGWGECASAGLMILMAGHERYISQTTLIMSHYASFVTTGTNVTHAMDRSQQAMALTVSKMMQDLYVKYTGKSLAYVKKHLLRSNRDDVYLTPTEAIRHGIVDTPFTSFENLALPVKKPRAKK